MPAGAQLDRAKLRGARERERREGGAPLHERYPEAVRMAKRLHRANPVTHERMSLRKIAAELVNAGHMMERGYGNKQIAGPFKPGTIKAMIEGPLP